MKEYIDQIQKIGEESKACEQGAKPAKKKKKRNKGVTGKKREPTFF